MVQRHKLARFTIRVVDNKEKKSYNFQFDTDKNNMTKEELADRISKYLEVKKR